MTSHAQAKMRTRNRLRRTIHRNRQEQIDACHEATKVINEAKRKSWKNLLQDPMSSSSGPVIWKVIQDLNGTPDANTPNEAISHEGRTITDIKSKANIFIKHYAWVNKLNMSHPIAISTGNSGNVSKHHLLTMKDVLHFNWVNYYLPSKR